MTISEIIKNLKKFKFEYGDLNVYVFEEGHGYSSPNLSLIMGDLNDNLGGLLPEIDIFKNDKRALLLEHDRWKKH